MSQVQTSSASGGIGLGGAFALLFTALKLTGVIDWSWWWVLAPLWIPVALFFGIVGVTLLVVLIVGGVSFLADKKMYRDKKKRRKAAQALDRYAKSL